MQETIRANNCHLAQYLNSFLLGLHDTLLPTGSKWTRVTGLMAIRINNNNNNNDRLTAFDPGQPG